MPSVGYILTRTASAYRYPRGRPWMQVLDSVPEASPYSSTTGGISLNDEHKMSSTTVFGKKVPMRASSCLPSRVTFGLIALSGLLVTATVNASPIENFTGYTRIGFPPTKGKKSEEYRRVASHPEALGATVYFMVLDRETGKVVAASNDSFGTRFAGFDQMLVAGLNSDRPNLDTKARYLYLYQIVNDSGLQAAVKDITIRLLVPTDRITSWGHFVDRTKNEKTGLVERQGLGFSIGISVKEGAESKESVRPVSTDFQGVNGPDEPYTSPSEPNRAPQTYGITRIKLLGKGGIAPAVAAIGAGEDPAKEPESVVLIPNADFSKVRGLDEKVPAIALRLSNRLGNVEDGELRGRLNWRTSWPALRATWRESPIGMKQRSVIFGFTSNDGPVTQEGALTPRPALARPAVGKVDAAITAALAAMSERVTGIAGAALAVDAAGEFVVPAAGGPALPVPALVEEAPPDVVPLVGTPLEAIPIAPGGGGLGFSDIGGQLSGGSVGGTSLPGTPAGSFAPRSSSGGGGFGSGGGGATGSGSGSGSSGSTGTTGTGQNSSTGTTQNQFQTVNVISTNKNENENSNKNVNININKDCCPTPQGNVVPAPPAWLLGILGMPVFAFISRSRKKAAEAAEAAGVEENPIA